MNDSEKKGDISSFFSQLLKFGEAIMHPKPFLADCPHCKKEGKETILKYRASHKLDGFYSTGSWEYDPRHQNIKQYLVFLGCIGSVDDYFTGATYVACDECIKPEYKDVFTYFPDGWEMTVFKTRTYGPFEEELKLDNL